MSGIKKVENTTSVEVQQVSNSVDLLLLAADIIQKREAACGNNVSVDCETLNKKNKEQLEMALPMATLLQQSTSDGISLLLLAAECIEEKEQICK